MKANYRYIHKGREGIAFTCGYVNLIFKEIHLKDKKKIIDLNEKDSNIFHW